MIGFVLDCFNWTFSVRLPTKFLYALLIYPIPETLLAHLSLLDFIILELSGEGRNCEAVLKINFRQTSHFFRRSSNYSPQHPVFKHPQSVFFP
jgi:hypothetical protein